MRVCPKCGFTDPQFWKQCAFRQHISYCRIGDIEMYNPELAEDLKRDKYASDDFYAYHLTSGGKVERGAIIDNPNWRTQWWVGIYERSVHNILPNFLHTPSQLANQKLKEQRRQAKLLENKS